MAREEARTISTRPVAKRTAEIGESLVRTALAEVIVTIEKETASEDTEVAPVQETDETSDEEAKTSERVESSSCQLCDSERDAS